MEFTLEDLAKLIQGGDPAIDVLKAELEDQMKWHNLLEELIAKYNLEIPQESTKPNRSQRRANKRLK